MVLMTLKKHDGLVALNASSGRLIWNYTLPYYATSPVLKSDVVYVGDTSPSRYTPGAVLAPKSNGTSPIGPEPSPPSSQPSTTLPGSPSETILMVGFLIALFSAFGLFIALAYYRKKDSQQKP